MLRRTILAAVSAAAAAAFAAPLVSAHAALVQPCHGSTYRYGALVWDPVRGEYIRLCIEQ